MHITLSLNVQAHEARSCCTDRGWEDRPFPRNKPSSKKVSMIHARGVLRPPQALTRHLLRLFRGKSY